MALAGSGLPTPAFQQLTSETNWQAVIEELGTVFVKPALEGSSLGMSKVGNAQELKAAYRHASTFGTGVMAEQFVSGPEYTVAILGDRALPSIRIDVTGDFYDFEAKYHSAETRFTCPADLVAEEEAALKISATRK